MLYDYLILGAGPTGLTLGLSLKRKYGDEKSVLILEKENEVGGLCRSKNVNGAPLDIGGGHFLDVRRPKVDEFCFEFMPKDMWNEFERKSTIYIHDMETGYPFEANIWQFPEDIQNEYLSSIKEAGSLKGEAKPHKFTDWIYWKLGRAISDNYMLPYNRKIFGKNLDLLGTYWLDKLPDVSYEDTLQSCRDKKRYGSDPGHTKFYYPKEYGYGEVFLRMGNELSDCLKTDTGVIKMDLSGEYPVITASDGNEYSAKKVITTIPWLSFNISGVDENIINEIALLKNTGIVVSYEQENVDTDAQWIYYPDEDLHYHRKLIRHNFVPESEGHWNETNSERFFDFYPDYECDGSEGRVMELDEGIFYIPYAYPLNTIDKPDTMKHILEYMSGNNVIGLGRWGEHMHYNSDVVMERALNAAEEL